MVNACSRNRCKDKSVEAILFLTGAFHAGAPMAQKKQKKQKDWSRAAYPPQRSLRAALGCCPTTAGGAQFCLLCCQPGPVPESLPARPPLLTQGRPCRPPVWLGHPIHTASRTCAGPQRSISQVPTRGTGRCETPQRKDRFIRLERRTQQQN